MTDWATGFLRASGGGVRPDRSELAQEWRASPSRSRTGGTALHLAAVDIVIVWATIIW